MPPMKRAQQRRTATRSAKKAPISKKVAVVSKSSPKTGKGKSARTVDAKSRKKNQRRPSSSFSREASRSFSGELSGDLQGLSNVETADSESVDELLEEGNAFEAGVVSGVEDSGDREGKEVRTREVPEDDVPGEYLDEE